jgi:hypothetical protein
VRDGDVFRPFRAPALWSGSRSWCSSAFLCCSAAVGWVRPFQTFDFEDDGDARRSMGRERPVGSAVGFAHLLDPIILAESSSIVEK